ncbi:MAG: formylglycine-generating enzyme family protein [Thermodesulfobacteriota bacterium]
MRRLIFLIFLFFPSVLLAEVEMALIPEGKFIIGSRGDEGILGVDIGVDELPQREIYLKAFYIDKYEVTVGDYKKFAEATGRPLPDLLAAFSPTDSSLSRANKEWREKVNYPPIKDNYPVNDVTYMDAEAYCKWAGKRLPTEEEWEKAARGTDGRIWPWGNKAEVGMANTIEWSNNKVAAVAVGSFPKDVSPYGVYDMAGNVTEWTSSWYEAYPGSEFKRPQFGKKNKVIKGGTWMGPIMPFTRAAHRNPSSLNERNHHPHYGFRCAKDG